MLTIRQVTVFGTSAKGNFAGTIQLERGLQIISAPNRFGKTLITNAIAWCLNLESLYGHSNADSSLFKGGILEKIDLLDQVDIPILTLVAEIDVSTALSQRFRIRRSVVGGDRKIIEVRTLGVEAAKPLRLITGSGALADVSAGFQAWLFSIIGIPIQNVCNKDGNITKLYFENIAPLFFIEQIGGWLGLQSRQIYKYRIEEISAVAFEYVLGLKHRLRQRIRVQEYSSRELALRVEITSIIREFIHLLEENGWTDSRPTVHGSLDSLSRAYSRFSLSDYVREKFHYDYLNENRKLLNSKEAVQKKLNEESLHESNRVIFSEQTSRLLELRNIKRKRSEEISDLRNQKLNQEDILRVLTARLESAKDLRRLKQQDIGQLGETECPTCHRKIHAEELHVTAHSIAEVDTHIDSLEKEIHLLNTALKRLDSDLKHSLAWARQTDEELNAAERRLSLIAGTIGTAKEAIVKLSFELTEFDRQLEKNKKLHERLDQLQSQLDDWAEKLRQNVNLDADPTVDESPRIQAFVDELRAFLVDVGHGALANRNADTIYLDNNYNPCINSRQLTQLGSASDPARLVLAYVLALLKTAIERGHHPGFVVLDEPLQQNPDKNHRELVVNLLSKKWPEPDGQVLVFTHVLPQESRRLRELGAPLRELTERRFLKPILSLNPAT